MWMMKKFCLDCCYSLPWIRRTPLLCVRRSSRYQRWPGMISVGLKKSRESYRNLYRYTSECVIFKSVVWSGLRGGAQTWYSWFRLRDLVMIVVKGFSETPPCERFTCSRWPQCSWYMILFGHFSFLTVPCGASREVSTIWYDPLEGGTVLWTPWMWKDLAGQSYCQWMSSQFHFYQGAYKLINPN